MHHSRPGLIPHPSTLIASSSPPAAPGLVRTAIIVCLHMLTSSNACSNARANRAIAGKIADCREAKRRIRRFWQVLAPGCRQRTAKMAGTNRLRPFDRLAIVAAAPTCNESLGCDPAPLVMGAEAPAYLRPNIPVAGRPPRHLNASAPTRAAINSATVDGSGTPIEALAISVLIWDVSESASKKLTP